MDPSERITADNALHSCWFDNYGKDASGKPSSEEAFQFDLSPYNLQEIRSTLFQKVRLIHQQMQDKETKKKQLWKVWMVVKDKQAVVVIIIFFSMN